MLMEAEGKVDIDRETLKRALLQLLEDRDVCKALTQILERERRAEDARGNKSVFI